jgi:hypothetical protein
VNAKFREVAQLWRDLGSKAAAGRHRRAMLALAEQCEIIAAEWNSLVEAKADLANLDLANVDAPRERRSWGAG